MEDCLCSDLYRVSGEICAGVFVGTALCVLQCPKDLHATSEGHLFTAGIVWPVAVVFFSHSN